MNDMHKKGRKLAGTSKAWKRQRGGIVPASPGSCQQDESSNGRAAGLFAIRTTELAIAEKDEKWFAK